MRLARALVLLALLDAIRLGVHFALYHDGVALVQIGALDVAAALLAAIASVIGPLAGNFLGSLALSAVTLGLPLALFGWICDAVGQHALSRLMAFAGLLGIGAGCAIATARRPVLALFGAAIVAGGVYGLVSIQQPREAVLIAAPAVLITAISIFAGFKRPRG